MKQSSFDLNLSVKKTRKRQFLVETNCVGLWVAMAALIAPCYLKGKNGRRQFAPQTIPRILFMRQWLTLSAPAIEKAFFDVPLFKQKGSQWCFGMKAHVGVDADSGLVYAARATAGNVQDINEGNSLLDGKEQVLFADARYQGIEKRLDAKPEVLRHVAMRPGKEKVLDKSTIKGALLDAAEKPKAGVRAKVEHLFRVIKGQFGNVKVRYLGFEKNTQQLMTLFALSNLWMMRSKLMWAEK